MSNFDEPDEGETFVPSLRSRATRNIGKRSKASSRVYLAFKGRVLQFESYLEAKVFYLLCSILKIKDVWEQPPAIRFTDPSGKNRQHFFDLLVGTKCGSRTAVVIKPQQRAAKPEFQDELKCIRAAVRKDFADRVVLITDAHFTRDQARNAERLHIFRQHADPELSRQLDAILPQLTFPMTIAEILSALGCGGTGFKTVFTALYDGRFSANVHEEITPRTVVNRGEG